MQLKDIKEGKKYYKSISVPAKDKHISKRERILSTVFVVEVDRIKQKVCASINGAPAIWYDVKNYGRWSKENPETVSK